MWVPSTAPVSASPWVFGQSVTLTATVSVQSPGVGLPSGTLTFEDGGSSLGTAVLDSSSGSTLSISSLALGMHSITAVYSGDSNFNVSTSLAMLQTVTQANTTTTVTTLVNPSVFGQSVMLTATVSAVSPALAHPRAP